MSQGIVIKILRENKNKWLTCNDIKEILEHNISKCSLQSNLKRLRKNKEVIFKVTYRNEYAYKIKW